MAKKKVTKKKTTKKFCLPKNPYDRNLSPEETQRLLDNGWHSHLPIQCPECYSRGCSKCHETGIVVSLWKEDKYYFGTPVIPEGKVGAKCSVYYAPHDMKLHLRAAGAGGNASIAFHYKQLFNLMSFLVNTVGDPAGDRNAEYGVEAEFRGPPAMSLAALTKSGVTVATIPNKQQKKALKVLLDAGLEEEARLLKSAFEHEVFRGDHKKIEEARQKIGEIKPGTIFERRGDTTIFDDGTVIKTDPGESILSSK